MNRSPLFFMFLFLLLLTPTAVFAQPADDRAASFSVEPLDENGEILPYFVLESDAGTVIHSEVRIVNRGNATGTARIYAVDAATGETGGTMLGMESDTLQGVGSWIQLTQTSVTLDPDRGILIPFTVSIPAGVRTGQHLGGLVVENEKPAQMQQGSNAENGVSFLVDVKMRTAVAVQVNIPGVPVKQIDILGIELGGHDGNQILYVTMRNSGTELVKPIGYLGIKTADNQHLQQYRFAVDTFLPDTQIKYPLYIQNEALSAGQYTAEVSIRYGPGETVHNHQLQFEITEAQNVQIFEGSGPLAAPQSMGVPNSGSQRPFWQMGLFITVGLLISGGGIGIILTQKNHKSQAKPPTPHTLVNQPVPPEWYDTTHPPTSTRRS